MKRGPLARVLTLLCILLVSTTLTALYRGYFAEEAQAPSANKGAAIVAPALTQRLLIILGDSVRKAPMMDAEIAPYFQEVAAKGISGDLMVPGPSLTGVSVTCFGTGITPPLKTAMTNFVVPPWPGEDLFDLYAERELAVGFFGDSTWYSAFDRDCKWKCVYPFTGFQVEIEDNWYKRDLKVIKQIDELIDDPDWNVLVVHFSTPDKLSHKFGAGLRDENGELTPYSRSIHNIDKLTREWHQRAGANTTLFSISDHGCTESGTHGGFSDISRRTRYAACGPGIRQVEGDQNLEGIELCPLLAGLFGLRSPRGAEAPLRHELLTHGARDAATLQAASLCARLEQTRKAYPEFAIDAEERILAAANLNLADANFSEDRAVRLANGLKESSSALNRSLVAEAKAQGRSQRLWSGLIVLVLALLACALFFHLSTSSLTIDWRITCAFAAAFCGLFVFLQVFRNFWAYYLMGLFRDLFRLDDFLAIVLWFGSGFALRHFWARWRRSKFGPRLNKSWNNSREWIWVFFFTLTSYLTVAWAFGPKVETYLALYVIAVGALAASRSATTSGRYAAGLALIGVLFLSAYSIHLLGGKVEVAYRVPDFKAIWVINLITLVFTVSAAGVLVGRIAPGSQRRLVLSSAFGAIVFTCAYFARTWDSISLGWAALGVFVVGMFFLPRLEPKSTYPLAPRSFGVAVLFLGLYRLFIVEGNLMFGLAFFGGAILLAVALARLKSPGLFALTTVFLYEMFYWFAQGYRYKLSTFDMNSAFAFADGKVNLNLALVAILLQHTAPLAIALAAYAASRPRAELNTAPSVAAVAFLYAVRIALSFLVLLFFENEGWYFLRSAHFQFFESIEMLSAITVMAVLLTCPRSQASSPSH
ncbi:MAG: alkaline phosphatase family protein [Planctomycetota bacterium]